jgi:DNA invertase Pin-like site-specific DNA recombinase
VKSSYLTSAVAKKKGIYEVRKSGTTKGKPVRVHELRSQGFKLKEIVSALGVSTSTVKRYLAAA